MNKKLCTYFSLAITILIFDRITKQLALIHAQTPQVINEYISFELAFNRGVSWGMFHDASHMTFVLVSGIIALITAFLCWHAYARYKKGGLIFGHVCVIAGSIANLIDRVVYGAIIDFIVLSYNQYSWPVFNIADMAIVCGVGLLVFVDEKYVDLEE